MFHNQQICERKSVWDVTETMPTVSEITNPSARVSYVHPQYSSDNQQIQQYKQAWTPDGNQTNDIKAKKSGCGPDKKSILTLLALGTLIGLFVCGIPLAVMTTMYLQLKSQASSNSSNTGSSGTNNVNSNSLPSQCTSYTLNTQNDRNAAYTACVGCECDTSSYITAGWYRFSGAAGTQLSTTPVSINSCSVNYPGWFNGSFPSTVGGTTSGTVCVNVNGNLCDLSYSVNAILVTNCNGFYVFYLTPMPYCNSRYCTT